jgi:hypothetical protein
MKLKQINLPLKAYIYGFMVLILFSTGCSKELEFRTNKSIGSETLNTVDKTAIIEDAKQWYEGQLKTPLPARLPKVLKDRNAIQPLWEQAIVTPISVEVPYLTNGEVISPSLSDKEDAQKGKGVIVVYRKGFKGKERTGRIWEFMPSEKSKGDMTTMTTLNFKKRQFDGLVAIWHLKGVNLGGYMIEQGAFKKKMYAKINPKANLSLGVREECAYCETETYDCHCGRILGGPRQCSTCEKQICYDTWGSWCNPDDGCEHVPDSCTDYEDGCNGAPNPDCNPCDADPNACDDGDDNSGGDGDDVGDGCKFDNSPQSTSIGDVNFLFTIRVLHSIYGINGAAGTYSGHISVSPDNSPLFGEVSIVPDPIIELDNSLGGTPCSRNILLQNSGKVRWGTGDFIWFSDYYDDKIFGYRINPKR